MKEGKDLKQLERENAKLEALRSKLNEMVGVLGVSNIKVLKMNRELHRLINIIQRRKLVSIVAQDSLGD